jgi:hypothetical protein
MNRETILFVAAVAAGLAAAAGTIATVAKAGPAPAKRQRVAISMSGGTITPFVLTPLSSGVLRRERGKATFCCWTTGHVQRDGQTLETGNPQMTLVGKRGTIVTRNRIVWMTIPNGAAIFTGTWRVVRATGAYAGLAGGGLAAGLMLANGNGNSRFTGFVSTK